MMLCNLADIPFKVSLVPLTIVQGPGFNSHWPVNDEQTVKQ